MYLLQAFKNVVQKVPDARLVIAGDGEQYKQAVAYAEDNNIPVSFLGAISHTRVKEEMDRARIFCLPSVCASTGDREGLPTVIMEAQAASVPVVTSAHGGATEGIIDGKTGFSFPEKDVKALTDNLITLLSDSNLLKRLSNNGPKFIKEKFDIRECTSDLELFYNNILNSWNIK